VHPVGKGEQVGRYTPPLILQQAAVQHSKLCIPQEQQQVGRWGRALCQGLGRREKLRIGLGVQGWEWESGGCR
jgi:hypothetical protein